MLFVGIDPGTTVGYAIFNTSTGDIKCYSQKEFSANSLIQKLSNEGKITLIATDKKKIPEFVKTVAVKLGALYYTPKEDILVKDKISLTSKIKYSNSHERDAIAAVLIAFTKHKHKIDDINQFLIKNNKINIKDKFIDRALRNPNNSYTEILNLIDKEIIDKENKNIKNNNKDIIEHNNRNNIKLNSNNNLNIEEKNNIIKKLIQDNKYLINYNTQLKNKNKILKNNKNNINNYKNKKTKTEKELMDIISMKEYRLLNLTKKNNDLNNILIKNSNKIKKLISYILESDKYIFLELIKNLRQINQEHNNILFIENINIYSNKCLENIKNEDIIISKDKINTKLKKQIQCTYIYWNKLFIDIIKNVIIIKKDDLKYKINNIENINGIIEDYKQKRKRELIN
jgi:uncharacterized protein